MNTNGATKPAVSTERPRVTIVIDSPNHMYCVQNAHGPDAEPDWNGVLREVEAVATVVAAIAVVNRGANPALWNQFEDAGYAVRSSDAPDCDEFVIAEIVRNCHTADIVVIGGGDGKYTHVAILLRQVGKRVVVLAVRGSVHADLLATADQFVDLPVVHESLPEAA